MEVKFSVDTFPGHRLKLARQMKRPKVSQLDIARLTGTTQATVSHWEKGTATPSALAVAQIALSLMVSLKWLLGLDSERPNVIPLISVYDALAKKKVTATGLLEVSRDYPPETVAFKVKETHLFLCPAGSLVVMTPDTEIEEGKIMVVGLPKKIMPLLMRVVKQDHELLLETDLDVPNIKPGSGGVNIVGRIAEAVTQQVMP